jgi:hypothetical protein
MTSLSTHSSYQNSLNEVILSRRSLTPPLEEEDPMPSLLSRDHLSLAAKVVYQATRPIFLVALYRGYFSSLYGMAGYSVPVRLAEELLRDLGGEPLFIPSSDGAHLQAMFFSSEIFMGKQEKVFRKWKVLFEQNPVIAKIFEVDLDGTNLRELMRLPKETIDPCYPRKKGVVHCLGAGTIFEMNPQYILQTLYRGVDHLSFNYRGIHKSSGSPSYEGTCNDAFYATKHLRDLYSCTNTSITVVGTSMGGGPALFAAKLLPGVDVVLDRTFSRLGAVKIKPFIQSIFTRLAEKFYPYPNEEWIGKIQGKVCIIHAIKDKLIDRSHAQRLVNAYQKDHNSSPSFILASGGHGSRYGGDRYYSWYADGVSQKKFSQALMGYFISDLC